MMIKLNDGLPVRSRNLSICEITTRDWTFEQDVREYVGANIPLIGVYHPKVAAYGIDNAARLLGDAGARAVSMISGAYLTGSDDRLNQQAFDAQVRMLDDCAKLGIERLVAVPGCLHGRSWDRMSELTVDVLARLAPEAKARNVVLALEPIRSPYFDFLHTLAEATHLARSVNSDSVGVVFDTWHLWNEPNLFERIKESIDLISLVHISDYRKGTTIHDDRLLPGQGVIPLSSIVRHLDECGYSGVFDVEIFSEELWNSDYRSTLRTCRAWFDSVWNDE